MIREHKRRPSRRTRKIAALAKWHRIFIIFPRTIYDRHTRKTLDVWLTVMERRNTTGELSARHYEYRTPAPRGADQ